VLIDDFAKLNALVAGPKGPAYTSFIVLVRIQRDINGYADIGALEANVKTGGKYPAATPAI